MSEYVIPATGQNVAMNAGAASASTQRTVTASDSPEVTSVASIDTKTPSLGQALEAASVPVVLPAAQVATLTPPAAISGFALESTLNAVGVILSAIDGKTTAVDTGAVVIASSALPNGAAAESTLSAMSGKLPATVGGKARAASFATTLSDEEQLLIGSVVEGAPASDTTSSGLNGRLQRIAQNITALRAQIPATLGIKTAANSLSVAPASDAVFVIGGSVAHDIVDAGNPIKMGGQARTSWPTGVANGNRVNATFDTFGRQLVTSSPRELRGRQTTTITSSVTETTIVAAGAAGVFRDIYKLVITNISATACYVTIRDATAGSMVETYAVPAGQTAGFVLSSDDAVPQTTAANNWTAECSVSVASIIITALYVEITDTEI